MLNKLCPLSFTFRETYHRQMDNTILSSVVCHMDKSASLGALKHYHRMHTLQTLRHALNHRCLQQLTWY